MRFLEYINGEIDFFEAKYLLDLIDIDKLSIEDRAKINTVEYTDVLTLCKYPVSLETHNDKNYLKDAVNYKYISYANKQDFFVVDRQTKSIVVDMSNLYYPIAHMNYELFNRETVLNLLKESIGDYKIYTRKDLKETVLNDIDNEVNNLLNLNHEKICKSGKEMILKEINFIDDLTNIIKINYIFDRAIEKPSFTYLHEKSSSVFYRFDEKDNYFLISYLRNQDNVMKLVNEEFYNALNDNTFAIRQLNYKYHEYNLIKQLTNNLKSYNENDMYLNQFREIILALSLAGKTVTINGIKHENRVDSSRFFTEIEIGSYKTNRIKIKDVKTMSFGRKTLFDIDEFMKKFKNIG